MPRTQGSNSIRDITGVIECYRRSETTGLAGQVIGSTDGLDVATSKPRFPIVRKVPSSDALDLASQTEVDGGT